MGMFIIRVLGAENLGIFVTVIPDQNTECSQLVLWTFSGMPLFS